MQPAGAFFYDDELELEKEFMTVVNAINGPESEQTMRFYPLIKRLKSEDGSVTMQEHGESTHPPIHSIPNNSNIFSLSACDLIDNGVAAIFGPSSKAASGKSVRENLV